MKRTELRQDMDEGLIDHVRLLLQYILTFVSQLRHYISRLEFTRITQKIRDEVGRVRSELAEKFVVVFGKLTGLKRRIQNLERSREGAEGKNCTVECGNLCRRNMRLEREMSDTMSITNHLRSGLDQLDMPLARNTVLITVMESQRARRAQPMIQSYNGTLLWKIDGYQRKRQDAINGVKTALFSHPWRLKRSVWVQEVCQDLHEWRWFRQRSSFVAVFCFHERRLRFSSMRCSRIKVTEITWYMRFTLILRVCLFNARRLIWISHLVCLCLRRLIAWIVANISKATWCLLRYCRLISHRLGILSPVPPKICGFEISCFLGVQTIFIISLYGLQVVPDKDVCSWKKSADAENVQSVYKML